MAFVDLIMTSSTKSTNTYMVYDLCWLDYDFIY